MYAKAVQGHRTPKLRHAHSSDWQSADSFPSRSKDCVCNGGSDGRNAGFAEDHAVYGALHALDGLLILGIAACLYFWSRRRES